MTVGRLLALDPDPASQRTAFQLSALLEPPNLSKMDGTSTESCTIHNGVTQLSIDPINSHASYFGKSTGSNKRSVPIDRTVSSNWHQRVYYCS